MTATDIHSPVQHDALDALTCRRFTTAGVDPYSLVSWERRDARITNWKDGSVAFEQLGVEVPATWSLNATNILAQKYFRGTLGTPEREWSLKQVVERVVTTVRRWGSDAGYFTSADEADAFADELRYLIITQRMAFNSPVWFNIGVDDVPQQASACFILDVEDTMDSILNWYREEGTIFKGGSGAGANLSKLRSSIEILEGGGTASGPVSFMRGADASAGTIKSGGKTRRAAKMVILNAEHPDIEHFIWCKAIEERKARVLRDAGFEMDLDGKDSHSVQYQNANNSVRVTDEFMQAVVDDADWQLRAVTTGEVLKTIKARDLMRQLAEATWECADPGMQFHDTFNRWNVTPFDFDGAPIQIDATNPCSEHARLANSACNLASLNLLAYLDANGRFDVDGYIHAATITCTAQDILVGDADYPTSAIAREARNSRDIGLGFANLGALLMALGHPYDSDEGRAWAATLMATLTGAAARQSARIAARLGAAPRYDTNATPWQEVWQLHRRLLDTIDAPLAALVDLTRAAVTLWDDALDGLAHHGARNAELTVLAPTGTIGLLMDCDTTGIEPDLGLSKTKKLVGGGTMQIVNQTVPRALRRLGYSPEHIDDIVVYIDEHKTILGAPHLAAEHVAVFACSMGDNAIAYMGHVRMMAAVQPWVSGAISKTVNLPEDVTVEEVEQLHIDAWKLGVKAIAIYRDNCKVGQPLSMTKKTSTDDNASASSSEAAVEVVEKVVELISKPTRERLPRKRNSNTFEFRLGDCKGFVHVGEYDDGRPGELFIKVSKQGSTLAGIMDAFAISVSHGLQYGVPLRAFVEAFTNMRFEPAGIVDDPDLRFASSLVDYIFRRLAVDYMTVAERADLGVQTTSERVAPTLPGIEEAVIETTTGLDVAPVVETAPAAAPAASHADAPMCYQCGVQMQRAGSCHACPSCGTTSGCS